MVVQEKSRRCCNIANAALVVVVAIPALIFHFAFLYHCPGEAQHEEKSNAKLWSGVCGWGREHPLGLVNVVFFLNVDVLFWFISLAQGSTWVLILFLVFWLIVNSFCFRTPNPMLPMQLRFLEAMEDCDHLRFECRPSYLNLKSRLFDITKL